jgi:predicted GTPase
MADAIVINKVDTAPQGDVETVEKNIRSVNQRAEIFRVASSISVEDAGLIEGKRVLVVEDGPTVTHGNMPSSVGAIAAKKFGAREMVNPRPYAVGSIKRAFDKYPHLSKVLPAMGYNNSQINDLRETIRQAECDSVVVGTSINLKRLIGFAQPSVRVRYEIESPRFESWILNRLKGLHT